MHKELDKELTEQQLIEENYRLVWSVVNRFPYMRDEKEDLFQTGCIGLIMAAKKFDPSKGFAFSTFAMPYILGEIRNYLREKSHLKVSKQSYRISRQIQEILSKNNQLSIKQLAEKLKMDYESVLLGYNLSTQSSVVSLDREIETNLTIGDVVLRDDRFAVNQDQLILSEIYERLDDVEKKIFYYRYHYGFTQSEIAKKLGVSQSKVSRIEKQMTENLIEWYKTS